MAPKQKAHSAAQAASKKKSSAVEIAHQHEQRIKAALRELGVPWHDAAAAPAAPAPAPGAPRQPGQQPGQPGGAGLPSEEQLLGVYAELLRQGFGETHVRAALGALPPAAASLESALDWLLLHLEPGELPRRYADQSRARAGGPVDVKHVAREPAASERAAAEAEATAAAEAAARAQAELAARQAAEAEARAAEAAAAEAARAAEEQARRAWILQYSQQDSDDGSGSEAGSSQVDGEVRRPAGVGAAGCAALRGAWSCEGRPRCGSGHGLSRLLPAPPSSPPRLPSSRTTPPSTTGSCPAPTCGSARRSGSGAAPSATASACRATSACA